MEQEIISVIVPVYNVEKYVKKCVQSIINQTYKMLEIILVDDGSTDSSGEICDFLEQQDSRITVIHKANGGLSDARNTGVKYAKGKYIAFVDSDDYIDPTMYSTMVELAKVNELEVVVCDYYEVEENDLPCVEKDRDEYCIILDATSKNDWEITHTYRTSLVVAWNKLYRKELFDHIRFPIGKIYEDEFTTYKILDRAQKIGLLQKKLYFYVQRPNSIMRKVFDKKNLQCLEALKEQMQFYKQKKDWILYSLSTESFWYYLIKISRYIFEQKREYIPELDQYIQFFKTEYSGNKRHLNVKGRNRMCFEMFNLSPVFFIRLKGIKNKL